MSDNLFENPLTALIPVGDTSMATWDDTKRAEFVALFADRTKVAKCVLWLTTEAIANFALSRKFVGVQKIAELNIVDARPEGLGGYNSRESLIGGRPYNELYALAQERADLIVKELPPVKQAVAIIDPATAKAMDQRDALITELAALRDQLEEVTTPIKLAEINQDMTIGAFRAHCKAQERRRKDLIETIKERADEAAELEKQIDKALFRGLPGLSEAIIEVLRDHLGRLNLLSQTYRRVEERVRFGDSVEALAILQHFEQDEVSLPTSVKEKFAAAMTALELKKGKGKRK